MKLEFRFCISPGPQFYSTIRLAALSLRQLGAPYDSARLRVSVGDYADLDSVQKSNRWSEAFPIDWQMVERDRFAESSYLATHNSRYAASSHADVIILSDSDLCVVRRIDELLDRLSQSGCRKIAGLQAHFSPFINGAQRMKAAAAEAEWRQLFAGALLPAPRLTERYSLDTADVMGRAPAYFNYGLVAFSRDAFAAVAATHEDYCRRAAAITNRSFFTSQIALTLTIAAAELDVERLPHAYNCANDELPFVAPENVRLHSTDEIRAVHFLRNQQLDRRSFLCDRAKYDAFLERPDLNRVNRRLRDHILTLAQHDEPFFGAG